LEAQSKSNNNYNDLKISLGAQLKLIYHTKDSINGGKSPFDTEIVNLINSTDNLKIMCPYIDLFYFKPLLKKLNSFFILTDIPELINSIPTNIDQIEEFIKNKSIRHIENLHAKAMISPNQAIFGSANFTKSGLSKNLELSIHINENKIIDELNLWFDENWEKGYEFNFSDVQSYFSQRSPKESQSSVPKIWQNNFINSFFSTINNSGMILKEEINFPKKFKKLPDKVISDVISVINAIKNFIEENNILVKLGHTEAEHLRFASNFKVEKCNNPITFVAETSKNRVKVFFRIYEQNMYISENSTQNDINNILETCFKLLSKWNN